MSYTRSGGRCDQHCFCRGQGACAAQFSCYSKRLGLRRQVTTNGIVSFVVTMCLAVFSSFSMSTSPSTSQFPSFCFSSSLCHPPNHTFLLYDASSNGRDVDDAILEEYDTLVVNSGAHQVKGDLEGYKKLMKAASENLTASMERLHGDKAILIVRNTSPGHWNSLGRFAYG